MKRYIFRVTGRIEVCAATSPEAYDLAYDVAPALDDMTLIDIVDDCESD